MATETIRLQLQNTVENVLVDNTTALISAEDLKDLFKVFLTYGVDSAFEIWREAGHTGTKVDFLAYIKGKSTYELAVVSGYVGTQAEWLTAQENSRLDAAASATTATQKATIATTKATEAASSATTATTKAAESVTSANSAATSASIATTKASEAVTTAANIAISNAAALAAANNAVALGQTANLQGVRLGVWNPLTNVQSLTADASAIIAGGFYDVVVAGTSSITGTSTAFAIGDRLAKVANVWVRIPFALADNSVPVIKLSFASPQKNLFNKATATLNAYLSSATSTSSLANYYATDFIPVSPSTNYATTPNIGSNAGGAKNIFYDANKNYISEIGNTYGVYFTTPANCYFIRLSSSTLAQIDTAQVEQGTFRTVYENYSFSIADSVIPASIARKADLPNFSNFVQKVQKNLFNKLTATLNFYLGATGGLNALSGFYVSDFISVLPSTNYATTGNIGSNAGGAFNCYYDANKNLIASFTGAYGIYFTTPINCYFVKLSSSTLGEIASAQVEIGTVRTVLEEAIATIAESLIPTTIPRKVDLPDSTMIVQKIQGKNLYNKTTNTLTSSLNSTTGAVGYNASTEVTDFISVNPSTQYIHNSAFNQYVCEYDAQKAFLRYTTAFNKDTGILTTLGTTKYIRVQVWSAQVPTLQIEQGSVVTTYEAYSQTIAESLIPTTIAKKTDLPDTSVFLRAVRSNNLFNKATATLNNYLLANGTLTALANYYVSDFIPVLPSTSYATTVNIGRNAGGAKNLFYDANKAVLSEIGGGYDTFFTTPANCYFIRLTSSTLAEIGTAQVEQGTNRTSYNSYYTVDPTLIPAISSTLSEIVLPATMYFVKNHSVSIYPRNIVLSQTELKVLANNWLNYNRQAVVNRTANETTSLSLIKDLSISLTKNIATIVTDKAINSGKTANILCIGDSFTDIGTWVEETRILLEADGVTVNLIGTMGVTGRRNEALSGGTMDNFILNTSAGTARIITVTGVTVPPSTGYPGITYKDENNNVWTCRGYKLDGSGNGLMRFATFGVTDMSGFPSSGALTKFGTGTGQTTINYSASVAAYFNPFWNPATNLLDFNYYLTKFSFANPTHVCIQFTWNDLSLWATDSTLASTVAKVKTIVDTIHTQLPSAKIVFSIEPMGAVDTTYDFFGKLYSVLKFAKAMFLQFTENSSYNTFVRIAPSYAYVDLKNGYTGSNVALSSRYPAVLEAYSDGVHCNEAGMRQIGDCVYDNISSFL
jgi:lysophospholipase L1-like esterase